CFPRDLFRRGRGLARKNLREARPRGPSALDGVADVDVVARLQKEHLPAWRAVRLGFVRDAGEASAVGEQQRILRARRGQLYVLRVHLLDFEIAVGIDWRRRASVRRGTVPGWKARQRHRA